VFAERPELRNGRDGLEEVAPAGACAKDGIVQIDTSHPTLRRGPGGR